MAASPSLSNIFITFSRFANFRSYSLIFSDEITRLYCTGFPPSPTVGKFHYRF